MEELPVRLPIKLSQFLKLSQLAETGGHATELITAGEVFVNGRREVRRAPTSLVTETSSRWAAARSGLPELRARSHGRARPSDQCTETALGPPNTR
ncbi:RNA-binding S4 domain-containing protein [Trueperella pyogenes]|uniref:RNA-binding S4 domain-containing protein n=1 Tax=Trueperella pyogenes TaxID=1661 RepID=UPI003872B323